MRPTVSGGMAAEQIAVLAELVERLAEHLGVDLVVLDTLAAIDRHGVLTWDEQQVSEELDGLECYLDRGEPFPPADDARGRTLRRYLMVENFRSVMS